MSATKGPHRKDKVDIDPSFDGTAAILPRSLVLTAESRVTFRGKNGNVEVPLIFWGAWSWGDKGTWHWNDSETPASEEVWKFVLEVGMTFVDKAQTNGSGESASRGRRLYFGSGASKSGSCTVCWKISTFP